MRGFFLSERRPPSLWLDDDAIAACLGDLVHACGLGLGLHLVDAEQDAELAAFLGAEAIRARAWAWILEFCRGARRSE